MIFLAKIVIRLKSRVFFLNQNFRRIRQEINELEKYAMNLNARKLN